MTGVIAAAQDIIAYDGLIWLVLAVLVAGLVRGFSGFGNAMIYMPVASSVLPPIWAITTMLIFDLFGPLPLVPRALREGQKSQAIILSMGALVTLPIGIWLLTRIDPMIFRYVVSAASLVLLGLLLSGWRYKGAAKRPIIFGAGALGGFLGGVSGLAGPPVILFYMSSKNAISTIRANILLYLLFFDLLALVAFGLTGLLDQTPLLIGLLLILPYTLGNVVGAAVFRPENEKAYRVIAYTIIAISAVRGLPIFG